MSGSSRPHTQFAQGGQASGWLDTWIPAEKTSKPSFPYLMAENDFASTGGPGSGETWAPTLLHNGNRNTPSGPGRGQTGFCPMGMAQVKWGMRESQILNEMGNVGKCRPGK